MKDITLPTSKLNFKGLKDGIVSGLKGTANAIDTFNLKKARTTVNNAQKSVRHAVADVIDSKPSEPSE